MYILFFCATQTFIFYKIHQKNIDDFIKFNLTVVQQGPTLQEAAAHRPACSTCSAHNESTTHSQGSGNKD